MASDTPHAAATPRASRATREARDARAARAWLDAQLGEAPIPALLIVIGPGAGAVIGAIEARAPAAKILAIEPDPVMARDFLDRRDVSIGMRQGTLRYLVGPSFAGAEDTWRLFPADGDGFRILTNPLLPQGEPLLAAMRMVKTIVFGVRANAAARKRFAPRYLRNVVRNIPAILQGQDVRALAGQYRGVPALITAAGPSLDAALEPIQAVGRRALLIATDTTLRPLLGAGVAPHLVVGADPGTANARHFFDLPPSDSTWLVAESALDHDAAAVFRGRTLWFRLANHHPWPWLRERGVDVGLLEMWGSVLTAAFELACLAGCDPIVIAGADLAFTGGRPYCRGTTYEFDWAYHVGSGTTLAAAWDAQMARAELKRVPDVHGAETTSTTSLLSFRDWMVARAERSGRRVVNAAESGILHGRGIHHLAIADALVSEVSVRPVADVAGRVDPVGSRAGSMTRELEQVSRDLSAGAPWPPPLAAWIEFSGEGFDPSAMAGALESARREAGDRPTRRTEATGAAPDACGMWSAAGLAESTARLLTAVRGDAVGPSATSAPAAAVEGLALLAHIAAATQALGRLDGSEHAGRTDVAIAVAYVWPEQLRWTVQRFEGLLGEACRSGFGPVAPVASRRALDAGSEPAPDGARHHALLRLALLWMRAVETIVAPDADGLAMWRDIIARLAALVPAALASAPFRHNLDLTARSDSVDATATIALPLWHDDASDRTRVVMVPDLHASATVRSAGGVPNRHTGSGEMGQGS